MTDEETASDVLRKVKKGAKKEVRVKKANVLVFVLWCKPWQGVDAK